jgi:hypothetical protein
VPQAIASIMTRPKGSGQSIGNKSASALPRNACFSFSPISPMNSMLSPASIGLIFCSKYSRSTSSTFAAILSGIPSLRAI